MEDFETVQQVLDAYRAGTIDADIASGYIDAINRDDVFEQVDDDHIRVRILEAVLSSIPPGASSDIVANFAWDVAQRIMAHRAKNTPIFERDTKVPFPKVDPAALAPAAQQQKQWGDGSKFEARGDASVPNVPNEVKDAFMAEMSGQVLTANQANALATWRAEQIAAQQNRPRGLADEAMAARQNSGAAQQMGAQTEDEGHDDGPF